MLFAQHRTFYPCIQILGNDLNSFNSWTYIQFKEYNYQKCGLVVMSIEKGEIMWHLKYIIVRLKFKSLRSFYRKGQMKGVIIELMYSVNLIRQLFLLYFQSNTERAFSPKNFPWLMSPEWPTIYAIKNQRIWFRISHDKRI